MARRLDEPLLRLMGYATGAYALGYVDDTRDPLEVVKPGSKRVGIGDLEKAQEPLGSSR